MLERDGRSIRPIRKIGTPNGQLASVYDVIDAIKGRSCNARTEFGRLVERYPDVVANCYDAKLLEAIDFQNSNNSQLLDHV